MNIRLRELIKNHNDKIKSGSMLDTYNQKVIKDISCTITTRVNASNEIYMVERGRVMNLKKVGMLENVKYREDAVVYDSEHIARCMKCNGGGNYMNDLRIRKLTPLECLKLQGFSEEDYRAISKRFGDSAIYHVAGDSISVSTLMAGVFGTMTNIDYRKATQDYVETLRGDYE